MSVARKVAKNTLWIIFGYAIQVVLGVITVACLARYLGKDNFGKFSFVFVYLGFFNLIIDFGIGQILVREVSRDREKAGKLIGNAIIIRLILSVFAIVLACLFINLLHYPFKTKLLIYIASLSFLLSISGLYGLIFQVNLKIKYSIFADICNGLLKLGLFSYFIYLRFTLAWFVAATVITCIPGIFIVMILSKKFIKPDFHVDFKMWKNLFREAFPLALTSVFIMIYARADQLLLFHMKGAQEVGYYAAIVKLAETFNMIPSAFLTSIAPLFYDYFAVSGKKLEKAYELTFKYLSAFVIPIVFGVFILAGNIIMLVYGRQFIEASFALRILIWSEIFVFLGTIQYYILVSVGLQKINFIITLASMVINVLLNLILIPRYGIAGASAATLVSYGLSIPILFLLTETRKYAIASVCSTLKPLLAAGLMGCFTYLAFVFKIHLAINIFLSACIYFGLLLLIKGLNKQDFEYIKEMAVKI